MTTEDSKKIALVTGGNAGIGFETCRGLLDAGFHVILCARTQSKADDAIAALLEQAPSGSTATLILDLASLESKTAECVCADGSHALCVRIERGHWPYLMANCRWF